MELNLTNAARRNFWVAMEKKNVQGNPTVIKACREDSGPPGELSSATGRRLYTPATSSRSGWRHHLGASDLHLLTGNTFAMHKVCDLPQPAGGRASSWSDFVGCSPLSSMLATRRPPQTPLLTQLTSCRTNRVDVSQLLCGGTRGEARAQQKVVQVGCISSAE